MMEAIVRTSRGGAGGCSFHRETVCDLAPSVKSISVRRSDWTPLLSSSIFQDQSHVQFYYSARCERKDRGAKVVRNRSSTLRELHKVVDSVLNVEQGKSVLSAKKMQRKVKAAVSSSSSSSSSSESEASDAKQMIWRKTKMEHLKQEWEDIARSPLMSSIPTISQEFIIGRPQSLVIPPVGSSVGDCCGRSSKEVYYFPISMRSAVSDVAVTPNLGNSSVSNTRSCPTFPGVALPCDISEVTSLHVEARVEVCMGGKCRKAGGHEVLSAFQANGVPASACNKCMKNCRSAVNVRVQQADTNPQVYSGIVPDDVISLSQKHFGVGAPLSGLPSFGGVHPRLRRETDFLAH